MSSGSTLCGLCWRHRQSRRTAAPKNQPDKLVCTSRAIHRYVAGSACMADTMPTAAQSKDTPAASTLTCM